MSVGVGQLKQASAADQQQQQVTSSNGTSSRRTSWVQLPPDHVNQVGGGGALKHGFRAMIICCLHGVKRAQVHMVVMVTCEDKSMDCSCTHHHHHHHHNQESCCAGLGCAGLRLNFSRSHEFTLLLLLTPAAYMLLYHPPQVLACNFSVMKVLGDRVLRPFLQDTIQVDAAVIHTVLPLLLSCLSA
jgi:hypothetical protein